MTDPAPPPVALTGTTRSGKIIDHWDEEDSIVGGHVWNWQCAACGHGYRSTKALADTPAFVHAENCEVPALLSAAPPPVALTQERIAEIRDTGRKGWVAIQCSEFDALLSAASSGAEAKEMVEELQTLVAYSAKLAIDREQRAAAAEAEVERMRFALAEISDHAPFGVDGEMRRLRAEIDWMRRQAELALNGEPADALRTTYKQLDAERERAAAAEARVAVLVQALRLAEQMISVLERVAAFNELPGDYRTDGLDTIRAALQGEPANG